MNAESVNFKNRLIKLTIKTVELSKRINNNLENNIFNKQIIRSCSSIGANYQESQVAQSKKEFIAKLNISLKEANETMYWYEVIEASNRINLEQYKNETLEIIKIITTIIKKTNNSM